MITRKTADRKTVEEYARTAYADLGASGFPEFGQEVALAIVDTASMYLYDAGFEVPEGLVREVAYDLAGIPT